MANCREVRRAGTRVFDGGQSQVGASGFVDCTCRRVAKAAGLVGVSVGKEQLVARVVNNS